MFYVNKDIYKGITRTAAEIDASRISDESTGPIIQPGKHTLFGIPFSAKITQGMFNAYKRAEEDFKRTDPQEYDAFKNDMQNMVSHKKEFYKIYNSLSTSERKKDDNPAWKYWKSTKWGKTQPYAGKEQSLVVPAGIWGGKGGGHKHGDQMDWAFGAPGGQRLPTTFLEALNRQDIYTSAKSDKGHQHHQNWSPRYESGGRARKRRIASQHAYKHGDLKGQKASLDRKPRTSIAPKEHYIAQKYGVGGYEDPTKQVSMPVQESRELPVRPTGTQLAARETKEYHRGPSYGVAERSLRPTPTAKPTAVARKPSPPIVNKSLFQSEKFIKV
jgi:hypothetical protein